MPSNIPVAPKSQYEIERDERIKRNEAFMLSIGIDPHGGGYMKQNKKKKAPSKPRLPRPKVPESERRRSSRLQGGTAEPERLTYDERSDDERPRQRSRGSAGRRARKNRLVELSDEQRAALATFNMDEFEAWMEPDGEHPISDDNRRQVIRQVTKLVSGEGVHYASTSFGWPDDVIFRKDEPVTMQSDIGQIIEDARDFENKHGRDHGNGWLLNHPLRKLLFYQHHLDTQARAPPPPAPAEAESEEAAAVAEPEPEPMEEEEAAPKKAKEAKTEAVVNQEELAPLLRVGAVVDAAAVAFGETYVKQARNGGPQNFRGTIVAAAVMDDHWNVKYDADGETYATEAQHLTLVSAPSDDDAPARRAKKRAAAATPKKAKKARKICVEC